MKWSKRIYFDKISGEKIQETGGFDSSLDRYTIDYEIMIYKTLSERNRETFDVLELPFGAYSQDFAECSGYRVNVETKVLEFSYPDPNEPEAPQVFQNPLSEQVKTLEDRQSATEEAINFLLGL